MFPPTNGQSNSGVQADPKVTTLAGPGNRISPTGSPKGVENRKADDGLEGKGTGKKRRPTCNGWDRSSKYASIRKDADFPK